MKEKNIFLLPTDKTSRLMIDTIENKLYLQPILHEKTINVLPQNIYITSSEKPKEGEYGLGFAEGTQSSFVFKHEGSNVAKLNALCENTQKIIITSDENLIADGVQRIEEKFLQWLVKNSSCEEVEVEMNQGRYFDYGGNIHITNAYKIIIPQEDPKHKIDMSKYIAGFDPYEKKETEQENCCTPVGQIKRYKDCIGCSKKPEPNFYEKLKEYFNTTPREKVLNDWNKSAEFNKVGPTVDEFIENSAAERLKDAAKIAIPELSHIISDLSKVREIYITGIKSNAARDYWFEKFKNK